MSTGICLLGEPIKTSKAKVNNKICDRVDEHFSIAWFYSDFWGNTCQVRGVTLIICKWYYKIIFFLRSLKGMWVANLLCRVNTAGACNITHCLMCGWSERCCLRFLISDGDVSGRTSSKYKSFTYIRCGWYGDVEHSICTKTPAVCCDDTGVSEAPAARCSRTST